MKSLSRKFITFSLIGILNTLIDFAFFNGCIFVFGLPYLWSYPLYKGVSFTIACINSYFLNTRFTFQVEKKTVHSFSYFFLATISGMAINILIATVLFAVTEGTGISLFIRANGSAIIATIVSMVWNFIFYNYVVFRSNNKTVDKESI